MRSTRFLIQAVSAIILTLTLLLVGHLSAVAQQGRPPSERTVAPVDSGTVVLRLVDGSTLYGKVVSESDGVVRLLLLSGDSIDLRRDRIRSITELDGQLVDGEVWRPDPNATRLFFGPTGRSLASGQGYFSVYELIAPFLAVGVSDRLTLAAGTPLIFGDGGQRPFWFAPKLQFVRTDRANAAIGVLHIYETGHSRYDYEEEPENYGIAYGVLTVGGTDAAYTLGIGMPYDGLDFDDKPIMMLGGEARTGRAIKFITENYWFPGEGFALLSAGPRFFGENLTADLGLAMPISTHDSGLFVFPLVSFVYNW